MSNDNPKAFKHVFSLNLLKKYASELSSTEPSFPKNEFLKIAQPMLDLEMKDRVRLIRDQFKKTLPDNYPKALKILIKTLDRGELSGFALWPFTEFVQTYGLGHIELSLKALKKMTVLFTSEFAVRPFIQKNLKTTLSFLKDNANDPNEHIRRWVSEGTRPRLPWGERLYVFIEKPKLSLNLIAPLKFDSSLYVRKSVANHLNDLAKDHPDLVVTTLKNWKSEAKTEDERKRMTWVIQRALRTLIKSGHPKALKLVGVNTMAQVEVLDLKIHQTTLKVGETLSFDFAIQSKSKTTESVVLDYIVHFVKSKGQRSAKVFKLKNLTLKAGESLRVQKNHSFREITTRKYYPGVHELEIQVNGNPLKKKKWTLLNK
jgi:3-methyladenine DNA glycosylase AlkC